MNKGQNKTDIAIIGMSCKFPKSNDAKEFWTNVSEGNELFGFYSDEELLKHGYSEDKISKSNFVKSKIEIPDVESFDYRFFNYTKAEAEMMDPQSRILHEQVWLALEDASCDISNYKKKIGLFLTASNNELWLAHSKINPNDKVNPFYISQLADNKFSNTLISYKLNLKGPSYYINTACSSSLTAVHLACRNLLLKECSIAVAGGAKIVSNVNKGYTFQEGMIFSKDGYCKAFDEDSSGTISGEGSGVVVLKRLDDAINDGDQIYAVIKSSAVNNDGGNKVGYTAPSIDGQSNCIKLAHKIAKIDPNTITYVEAHGTGTKLGDPIEIGALNKAFNYDKNHKCYIGSVKTNLGHLDTAAGITGLIKTALAIKNKLIPPSLNFTRPNPEINFGEGPFQVVTELKQWRTSAENPIRAGVSSFGIGGTNAHVILEEAPFRKTTSRSRPYQLLTYSANTFNSLTNYSKSLSKFLESEKEMNLADVAYSLNTGRKSFKYRNYIVSENDMKALQNSKFSNNSTGNESSALKKNLVFLFSGQGSQYFKMGKDLYEQETYFKNLMDSGFDILKSITNLNFKKIIGYTEEYEVDETLINETQYTQPLLFLIEYSIAKLLLHWGVSPKHMIGHSLGEYVVACISGVFSFEDGLELVVRRGELMSKTSEGAMLYVDLSRDKVERFLNEDLSIAAINTPDTVVISGKKKAIENLISRLEKEEITTIKLKTSHAFHSILMDEIIEDFKKVLEEISFNEPKMSFISNLYGKEISDNISPEYWINHLRNTVRFSDGINSISEAENLLFVEIGPGNTLLNFCKKNIKSSEIFQTIRHPKEMVDDNQKLTIFLGELYTKGVDLNWENYYEKEVRNKVSIPKYCFDKYVLDVKVDPFENISDLNIKYSLKSISDWFYEPSWKRKNRLNNVGYKEDEIFLIFEDSIGYSKLLVEKFRNKNNFFVIKKSKEFLSHDNNHFELDTENENHLKLLFKELSLEDSKTLNVIQMNSLGKEEYKESLSEFNTTVSIVQSIKSCYQRNKINLYILTNNVNNVIGNEEINLNNSINSGIPVIISQENNNINCCCIDLALDDNKNDVISNVFKEINSNISDNYIAYRNKYRWVKSFNPVKIEKTKESTRIREKGTYLITGGLGNLGYLHAKHLLENYNASVIILGRSEIENNFDNNKKALRFEELSQIGNAKYYNVDLKDVSSLQKIVDNIEDIIGEINGVFHFEGTISGNSIKVMDFLDKGDLDEQFEAKVLSTITLGKIFYNKQLDFCLLSSSLSTIIGGKESIAYLAANSFLDSFCNSEVIKNCITINYDGFSFNNQSGNNGINSDNVIDILNRVLSLNDINQIVVSTRDIDYELSKWITSNKGNNRENTINDTLGKSKIDEIDVDRSLLSSNYIEPTSPIEMKLIDLFQNLFDLNKIGIEDNFLELGGNSLLATQLINKINKELEIEISISEVLTNNTIKDLALLVEERQWLQDERELSNEIIL
ncbi:acyltransferase domain-containing protein [Aquimarina sp. MMG015]|uniref:type I polyketide synthase n=1 Tax=Aquimarina sp. MMG015 TaxID=2822689 RepID=UPI001B3A15E6|nr:type I polyketide synthase [Aquimarina sp. MMG015]MBQ4803339.1 acyltransferase domain-containing protein [Aquimarina sp. MMG015]